MGTNCAPLVANLFLFCNETDFLMSFSEEKPECLVMLLTSTLEINYLLLNFKIRMFGTINSEKPFLNFDVIST